MALNETSSEDRAAQREALSKHGLGDFADWLTESGAAADVAAGLESINRPRPTAQPSHRFDLGAFYDRIGLAREDAAALQRLLDADARRHAGGAPTERGLETDLFRLESLLATLDIDLSLDDLREPPRETVSARCGADDAAACPEGACAVDGPVAAAGRRLEEALETIEAAPDAPERMIATLSGGRMALILDTGMTQRLRAAAAEQAARPEALIAASLDEALPA